MKIHEELIELATRYSLKEKALAMVVKVLDSSIEADKELGIDFLEGNNKEDLTFEFGRFEFRIDKGNHCKLVTIIDIYSAKIDRSNYDLPVGYYEVWTDMDGEPLDHFLIFDWSPLTLNMNHHIEQINSTVPLRYFKRNILQYEFTTYVNHVIALSQGKQYVMAMAFVRRSLDFLESNDRKEIDETYLIHCQDLFKNLYQFVINNNLVDFDRLSESRIRERLF
ncbi:hypothetical protein [Fulvivirga ligni]|uniref:hypothetical protein n=1 Tax=Fulvivirga ligni TaxID=2904246 RepID=UPI001F1AF20E|nr:hypothetical protein [Fulvivirga ligni]UII22320.1 hypothetical protein LVD16_03635 [Fulvivirga ligni]